MPGFMIPIQNDCGEAQIEGGPSHTQETARKHRFLIEILEPLRTILINAEKCGRPAPEFDKILVHSAQDEIPRPGKTHWKEVEFTFYEVLNGSANNLVNTAAKAISDWHKSMVNMENSLHFALSNYLKHAQLQMLDGDGNPVWTYYLYESWPMKVSPSDLDYSDSNICRIGVTLAYARAVERKGGLQ